MDTRSQFQTTPLDGRSGSKSIGPEFLNFLESPNSGDTIHSSYSLTNEHGSFPFSVKTVITGLGRRESQENSNLRSAAPSPTGTSPSYLAAIRRQECRQLAIKVKMLEQQVDSDDFAVFTNGLLDSVRKLHARLFRQSADFEGVTEGNSCEVLRQIRDSLMRLGWQKYRDREARETVLAIIKKLSTEDSVGPEVPDSSMDAMLECGLEPVLEPLLNE